MYCLILSGVSNISASPFSCKSLMSLEIPSFFMEAVNIDREFLVIASIGFTLIKSSLPFNSIDSGLLGKEPAAIRGP